MHVAYRFARQIGFEPYRKETCNLTKAISDLLITHIRELSESDQSVVADVLARIDGPFAAETNSDHPIDLLPDHHADDCQRVHSGKKTTIYDVIPCALDRSHRDPYGLPYINDHDFLADEQTPDVPSERSAPDPDPNHPYS